MEVRASEEDLRAQIREDMGLVYFLEGAMKESELLTMIASAKITDEALAAEASRRKSLWLRFRVREEVDEPEFDEARQKREVSNSSLDDSSLAKFSKSLGFTTEGVEGEILKLLLRLKRRRDQGIYGPTMKRFREFFWEELGAIRGLWNDPWCIGGDFNMIRFPDERRRGGRVSPSMRRFSEVIDDLDLRDLPLQGARLLGVVGGIVKLCQDWIGFWCRKTGRAISGEERANPFSIRKHVVEGVVARKVACSLSMEELEAKGDYKKWALMEEISWRKNQEKSGDWHPTLEGLDLIELTLRKQLDWRSLLGLCEEEMIGFLKEFHEHGRFVRSLNSTFLVLIPKNPGAEDLRDFRSISLVGGLYKLLAKVLANRLKKVVGKVVSSAQNAFVEGRQILDATLIANKAIDSLLKRNESGVLCKLDIEKAYDHLN
ncbi:hypothetical protein CK203_054053 [Vitis vinifera]|uniref:Reverse transcriptase domain-containing protein n=1 Tax=Vitis vinifera TaxID=29760 RepID=A0A438GIH7_VITVI|nr:hypothetical protein CK203_054053 [Vitis vinifera]